MLNTLLSTIRSFDVEKEYVLRYIKILYNNFIMPIECKAHHSGPLIGKWIYSFTVSFSRGISVPPQQLAHLFNTRSLLLESFFQPILYAKKTIHNSLCVTVSYLQPMTIFIQTILNRVLESAHSLPLHIFSIFF